MLLTRFANTTFRISTKGTFTIATRMASTDNAFAVQEASKHATAQVEAAKRKAAFKAVEEHFRSDMTFVGIGSGSTIVYGVEAIKAHLEKNPPPPGHRNWFVPTGWNSRKVIEQFGLDPLAFDSIPAKAQIEVAFDGADEVDAELNCIKGGGACLFQEKLVRSYSLALSERLPILTVMYRSHECPRSSSA